MKCGILILTLLLFLSACNDDRSSEPSPAIGLLDESLIICNEGNWQSDNGQLSYLDAMTGELTNKWFRSVNGFKLGDTPNDIIQINDTLIAISVNWSNIIQYINPDGTACGATENVPNNRRLCTDGQFLYVTSFAHICGSQTYEKGYVAKIDVASLRVVASCGVGWEPDGIALYDGRLYIANSGGYAFSESHDYETSISIVDAATMTKIGDIMTDCPNLSGPISRAGKFLCINSNGNGSVASPKTIILNCETDEFSLLDFPSNLNASDGELFYTIGSVVENSTGESRSHIHTINPSTMEVGNEICSPEVTSLIGSLEKPYDLYISPYTGSFYCTYARNFTSAGLLYGYSSMGEQLFEPQKLYINPAHILALPRR